MIGCASVRAIPGLSLWSRPGYIYGVLNSPFFNMPCILSRDIDLIVHSIYDHCPKVVFDLNLIVDSLNQNNAKVFVDHEFFSTTRYSESTSHGIDRLAITFLFNCKLIKKTFLNFLLVRVNRSKGFGVWGLGFGVW